MLQEFILTWKNIKIYRWYILLLILAGLKQLFFYTEFVDSGEFVAAAKNLLETGFPDSCLSGGTCDHWLHETRRTPGYPILLIITGLIPGIMILLQVTLAAAVPVLVFLISDRLNCGAGSKKWMMWFFLLYPLQIFYPAMLMPEIWCQFLLLYGILAALEKNWTGLGVTAVFLMLLKPVFITLLPLLIPLLWPFSFKKSALFLPLLVMLVIAFWNQKKTGLFHFSSIPVENFWEYNQVAVLNTVMTESERQKYFDKSDSVLSTMNFSGRYHYMDSEAKKNAISHWKLYAWLHVKGSLLAMADPGRYDLVAFTGMDQGAGFMGIKSHGSISNIFLQPWYILLYMAIFIMVNAAKWILLGIAFLYRWKKLWFLFAVIAIQLAVIGPVGSARYLFSLMPLIILLAGEGMEVLKNKRK